MKIRHLLFHFTALAAFALTAPAARAQQPPAITIHYEPMANGAVQILRMSEPRSGGSPTYQLSLAWAIVSNQVTQVNATSLDVSFPNSTTLGRTYNFFTPIPGFSTQHGSFVVDASGNDNIILSNPPPQTIRLRLNFSGGVGSISQDFPLERYNSPTSGGSVAFWAKVGDLRPEEYWQAMGAVHGTSVEGCQLFAHDVGVFGWNGSIYTDLLPGADPTLNESYRQWGKPIYAVADGIVRSVTDGVHTNVVGVLNPAGAGGNGFVIETNNQYEIIYSHMQAGSLNPAIDFAGASVSEGQFLGLVGNSGNSSKPHLHIGAIASDRPANLWSADCGGPLAPLPLRGSWVIASTHLDDYVGAIDNAPWSYMNDEGVINGTTGFNSMIWPSASSPTELLPLDMIDFDIGTNGQLWVVRSDNQILTTDDRFAADYNTGAYLDVVPGGSAKEVAFASDAPYIIGMDDHVWRGTSTGWVQTTRTAKRITIDESTGKVWAIGLNDRIYSFNPSTLAWTAESPTTALAKDIAVFGGVPVLIGMDDRIYKRVSGSYVLMSATAKLKRIAADGASGNLWGIGFTNDEIYHSSTGASWSNYPGSAIGRSLQVYDGNTYLRGMNDMLYKQGAGDFEFVNVVRPN